MKNFQILELTCDIRPERVVAQASELDLSECFDHADRGRRCRLRSDEARASGDITLQRHDAG